MPKKLAEFRLASEEEIQIEIKKATRGFIGEAIYPWSPGGIHRSIIYKIMDEAFGPYNLDPGEKSTWGWIVYTDGGLLTVYDYKGGWSVGRLYSDISKELETEATSLRDALIQEAKKIVFTKKQIAKEKIGGSIRNPYSMYRAVTATILKQADSLKEEIRTLRNGGDFSNFVESMNVEIFQSRLFIAAFMNTFLSLEGFVNLVYRIFLRKRYQNEIYERRLKNEMLPIKILEMDVYCHSFLHPPFSEEDELFSAVQYFLSLRNSFLHANICDPMESHLIKHGEYLLHVKSKAEGKTDYGLGYTPQDISKDQVIRANRLVEKFVIKTIQAMKPGTKDAFAIVHSYVWLDYYWDKEDSTAFPLDEDDIRGSEESLEFLEQSTKIDKEYFAIDKT